MGFHLGGLKSKELNVPAELLKNSMPQSALCGELLSSLRLCFSLFKLRTSMLTRVGKKYPRSSKELFERDMHLCVNVLKRPELKFLNEGSANDATKTFNRIVQDLSGEMSEFDLMNQFISRVKLNDALAVIRVLSEPQRVFE